MLVYCKLICNSFLQAFVNEQFLKVLSEKLAYFLELVSVKVKLTNWLLSINCYYDLPYKVCLLVGMETGYSV